MTTKLKGFLVVLSVIAAGHSAPQNDFFQDLPVDFDPYQILGVVKTASQNEIRRAFRKQSLKFHPDKQGDHVKLTEYQKTELQEKFEEISRAYEILGDPDTRNIFDNFGGEKFENEWEYRRAQKKKGKKAASDGFYQGDSDLILPIGLADLTPGRLRSLKQPLLVEFYAPWCIHCQHLAPQYKRLALLLQDKMTFGAVNCEKRQRICQEQDIHAYPLLRLFTPKGGVEDYDGELNAESIQHWIDEASTSTLVQINPDIIEHDILNSPNIWVLVFSLPQCGPCQQLVPTLRHLSRSMSQYGVKFGIVSCDDLPDLCEGIPYFPFINLLPKYSSDVFHSIHLHADPRDNPGITILEITKNVMEAILSPTEVQDKQEVQSSSGFE